MMSYVAAYSLFIVFFFGRQLEAIAEPINSLFLVCRYHQAALKNNRKLPNQRLHQSQGEMERLDLFVLIGSQGFHLLGGLDS